MNIKTITIREYLTQKSIPFRESGGELITKCLFGPCDSDSTGNEGHLYFNAETSQYDCKKCGAKGNLHTLAKHLGDSADGPKRAKFRTALVEQCHQALPEHIRKYLNARGISDAVIDEYQLGYGRFYRKEWITIPIKDIYGNYTFFKLRQDPDHGSEKITYPKGEAQLYDWETLTKPNSRLVVCEGELDRLALISRGVAAVTGTHGAGTFKEQWVEKIGRNVIIYICFDNDEAGRKGAERIAKMLENVGNETHIITLPPEVGRGGDITDYFVELNGSVEDLFGKYAKPYPERIDTSQFSELTPEKLIEILGLTIKHDAENKLTTFLCELSAYTESSQFNISYNAPSSTGKSYIPLEIAHLFPSEDVMKLGNCSPTAFFHEQGEYDKEKNIITVDLSRKIIIFLDQPHALLLERLRSLLSHDEKEMYSKITDKNQRGGNRTKTVMIKGFPAVIFCSAGLRIDEQEATRFLLLSPEVSQQKIREGITATIRKEADSDSFKHWLEENPERALLKERIRAIKLEGVTDINIADHKRIEEKFLNGNKMLKPRNQRDIKYFIALVKTFSLLNVWWRERNGSMIVASKGDIDAAFALWEKISPSQELGIQPYIFNLYNEVILTAWREKNANRNDGFEEVTGKLGLTRQKVLAKYYTVHGRMLDGNKLRQQILPMLETAGLIMQEHDPSDKRKVLIYPPLPQQISSPPERNSETRGGVEEIEPENNSEPSGGVSPDVGVS